QRRRWRLAPRGGLPKPAPRSAIATVTATTTIDQLRDSHPFRVRHFVRSPTSNPTTENHYEIRRRGPLSRPRHPRRCSRGRRTEEGRHPASVGFQDEEPGRQGRRPLEVQG